MDIDTQVKLAVYRHFAETGLKPTPEEIAHRAGLHEAEVLEAYPRLRAQRVLLLEPDGRTIRMAPPFSGVPTQHVVSVGHSAVLRQLRLGRPGHTGGAAPARGGALALRRLGRRAAPESRAGRT